MRERMPLAFIQELHEIVEQDETPASPWLSFKGC